MTDDSTKSYTMDRIIALIDDNMDIKETNTRYDDIANLYTKLSGDTVDQDSISQFILTLMRLGRISKEDGFRLNSEYLSIKYA